MQTPLPAGTVCATCGEPLNAGGSCLTCLLRGGLKETALEEPPAAAPCYGDFEVARREDGSLWELGRGAMGVTYKAVDRTLHRAVALKVIQFKAAASKEADSRTSTMLRERFLREARAAAALRHAHVATVFHFGASEQAGDCYYAMELVEGETLDARVRRDGPLSILLALEMTRQVCTALVAAAGRGLIHRDLKPSNLMLTGGDASGTGLEVKVIDFGLAKATAAAGEIDLTHGGFVGTPAFASPEQFAGQPVDARTDIYSLGVTLWYALTGRAPFAGKSLEALRYHPARTALPVEQLTVKKVPAAVVALLRAMLAEDPAERPTSARELMAALENCRSTSTDHGTPLPVKRQPVVMAFVLVLALAGGWWVALGHRQLPVGDRPTMPPSTSSSVVVPPALLVVEKSIAVLPFGNLSDDKANAYFTDGVQNEILTDLAKIADLRVIARSSVMQYKSDAPRNLREVGVQLGVAHVLEGSVQRAGNKVRVTAQLIDTRTAAHLWAERYDRDLADVFAIQSEIAEAIAGQLQARLSPQEKAAIDAPPTTDLQAYDLYLRAQNLFADNTNVPRAAVTLPEAASLLGEALVLDPKFLRAWCLLGEVHTYFYFQGHDHTAARLEQAHAAIEAAARLQPDAGETHRAWADYHYHGFRDYKRARVELDLAKRTLPNSAEVYALSGYIDRRQGRWDEAMRNLERALELDPRNFLVLQQLALSYLCLRRYDDEVRMFDRALTVVPGDPNTRIQRASMPLDRDADIRPWQTTFAALLAASPGSGPDIEDPNYALCERTPAAAARLLANLPPEGIPDTSGANYTPAWYEGLIARWQGDAPRARAAFTTARAEVAKTLAAQPDLAGAVSLLGLIEAGLGRKEEAIAQGRRACALLPIEKDAIDGLNIAVNLAIIYAWTGETAAAVNQLTAIEKVPNSISYGQLKLNPAWDDLRGDPGFEALVASLAPKP